MSEMQRADFRFTFPFRVRFSEVDKQGIVFNAHYLVYFDTAISEYFRALPFDVETKLIPKGTDVFMVKMQLEFFAPLHFDDEIDVGVRSRRVGRSSLTFELAVFQKGGDSALTTSEIIWVNAEPKEKKSAPWPTELVQLIQELEGDQVAIDR